ncbi:MAG: type IX secretion system sortase PorU [Bacteroidales bacterium]|nr:type IX secretion system sortase PorU [Bacteroidales bacterium]
MKKLLLFIMIIIPIGINSQSLTIQIHWTETDSIPFFQNALYDNHPISLPHYVKKIPWENVQTTPVIQIKEVVSGPLNNRKLDSALAGLPFEEPLVEYEIVRENTVPYLVIKFLPFIISRETGEPEKITGLRLEIGSEPALAGLKSTMRGLFRESSVLKSGSWYRIAVEETGIHKLTYSQLKEIGLQNPASVRIFGSGAVQLPEDFTAGHQDDLSPVPLHFEKGSDNLFGQGDYILFFAKGPVDWYYDETEPFMGHDLHSYSRKGFYFLTDNNGPPDNLMPAALSGEPETHTITSFDYLLFLEEELYNLLHSGREWYGTKFSANLSKDYPFRIPDPVTGEPVRIRVAGAARSNEESSLRVTAGGDVLGNLFFSATNLSNYTAIYAYEDERIFSVTPENKELTVTIEYLRPNTNSEAWINFITVNARNRLNLSGDQLIFQDTRSVGFGNTGKFRLSGITSGTVIWEITDPGNPMKVDYTRSGETAEFRVDTDHLRRFVAFRPDGSFPSPEFGGPELGAIKNQDLHGLAAPDMIILYNEIFEEQARRLADFRTGHDGLEVILVEQQQIFNEFSSGAPDVTAIRNFLKMFYDRVADQSGMPRYLLLFGDGSYDNRSIKNQNPNKILTYQSENSLSPTNSYVSDDFYGLLDSGESLYSGLLDIGIGRLPVSTPEEAGGVVDKIISYGQKENQGEWRNYLCFIGDDEDANIHMKQADILARTIESHYPNFNVTKIYLDAYPQVTTPTGDRYPDVSRLINEQVRKGALIINYTGHGGPNGLAHEQILTRTAINAWKNGDMLPLFMTATCEFSRYDEYDHIEDLEITSAGEEVLLNPAGGGIALFTTTRLVYSGPNHVLNERFYEIIFESDEKGRPYRMGDIMKFSKNEAGSGLNKRNFTLLGDPSLKLAVPEHFVITDSINGLAVNESTDTVSALEYVTISGHIEDASGTHLPGFNGVVSPVVYDKERMVETLANDGGIPWNFSYRNNLLYRGTVTVSDGKFRFGFYMPKDINYATGNGKISYYGTDSLTDAHGSSLTLLVGGIGEQASPDNLPPDLQVYMNDSLFRPGGITDPDPELLVYISDNYGINTTGNGIGHDITATLDGDRLNAIILNDYYRSMLNSFNSGTVRYPYSGLEPGRHEITVKVWDIHNNSSEASLEFIVMESEEMLIKQLYNYPNPFFDRTWFNLEHNRPDNEMQLQIRIYNLSGQLVKILERNFYSGGYRIEPVEWDGKGAGGSETGAGLYIYEVILITGNGEMTTKPGRLIIAR